MNEKTMSWMDSTLRATVVAAGCCGLSAGCVSSARIAWAKPYEEARLGQTVYLASVDRTSGARDAVGRHTWSLFALPGHTISSEGETVDARVVKAIADAITTAGYDVKPASEAPANAPKPDDLNAPGIWVGGISSQMQGRV